MPMNARRLIDTLWRAAVLLLALALPFEVISPWLRIGGLAVITNLELIAYAALALWLIRQVVWRQTPRWQTPFTIPIAGLLLVLLLSALLAPGENLHALKVTARWCTGAVSVNPKAPTDGVWMLDYRGGKLLGTVIDRTTGKIGGWAEVDLVSEFGIKPKQPVHFMMTTGTVTKGQAALYIAETTTGRFGIYTMGPRPDGRLGRAKEVTLRPTARGTRGRKGTSRKMNRSRSLGRPIRPQA